MQIGLIPVQRQLGKKIHVTRACLNCGISIKSPKIKFCSRKCGLLYRDRVTYKGKYTKEYYSKTPRNFFMSLLQKKQHKRENLTLDFLEDLWNSQKGLCAITGRAMTHIRGEGKVLTNASIDRIDSTKGYEENNIQLVCYIVNIMKSDLTIGELKDWCREILKGK